MNKKSKLVIQINVSHVFKTICEIDFPEEGQWQPLGLKIEDLAVYNKDAELIFFIEK